MANGASHFTARSKSQVYRAANLSRAYGEVRNYRLHDLLHEKKQKQKKTKKKNKKKRKKRNA
jgi:hypothetical protein